MSDSDGDSISVSIQPRPAGFFADDSVHRAAYPSMTQQPMPDTSLEALFDASEYKVRLKQKAALALERRQQETSIYNDSLCSAMGEVRRIRLEEEQQLAARLASAQSMFDTQVACLQQQFHDQVRELERQAQKYIASQRDACDVAVQRRVRTICGDLKDAKQITARASSMHALAVRSPVTTSRQAVVAMAAQPQTLTPQNRRVKSMAKEGYAQWSASLAKEGFTQSRRSPAREGYTQQFLDDDSEGDAELSPRETARRGPRLGSARSAFSAATSTLTKMGLGATRRPRMSSPPRVLGGGHGAAVHSPLVDLQSTDPSISPKGGLGTKTQMRTTTIRARASQTVSPPRGPLSSARAASPGALWHTDASPHDRDQGSGSTGGPRTPRSVPPGPLDPFQSRTSPLSFQFSPIAAARAPAYFKESPYKSVRPLNARPSSLAEGHTHNFEGDQKHPAVSMDGHSSQAMSKARPRLLDLILDSDSDSD